MKKLLTLFFVLVASIGTMFAWDYNCVQIDNLYYNLDASNQTAEVTSQINDYPYWSTSITVADIPSSVTYNEIEYSVTSIGKKAFYGHSSLTAVTIPNSVTSINNNAFTLCSGLTSIEIPNSVTIIGKGAFSYCSFTSVTLPSSVTSIEGSAFGGCDKLTSFNVAADNEYYSAIDGVLFNKDKTTLIQYPAGKQGTTYAIPSDVTTIGEYAFYECTGLTSITLPNHVANIEDSAFRGCSGLTSVTIPNSVTSIKNYAFFGCASLTSITCEAVNPPDLGGSAGREAVFSGVDKSIPLYVPEESITAYQTTNQWKDFTNIHAISDQQSVPAVYTNPENPTQKLIRKGKVYILKGDKTYTLTGQEVK